MNQWLEQHRTFVLASIGLLIAGGLAAVALRWETPAPIRIEPPPPTATVGPIRVYISGAVAQADVYELPPNSIVRDAINAAGGTSNDANLEHLNLAAPLRDGDAVYVPRIGESPTPTPAVSSGTGSDNPVPQGPININTASQAELETLPDIGEVTARAIIEYRDANGPFPNIEAIQNVPGIGPVTFEKIKDFITVE